MIIKRNNFLFKIKIIPSLLLVFYVMNISVCFNVIAQNVDLKFEHFIDDKGFTQNSVMKVIQDLDGYIWVGTLNGLYKYDGQRFTVFRHQLNNPNSLVSNSVYELELDVHGNLLIGTGKGLSKLNRRTQKFSNYPVILEDARITAIYPDTDGSLWVGTLHSGLYFFKSSDTKGETPVVYNHKPNLKTSINSNQIHAFVKDQSGGLWVGTVKGLNKVITKNEITEFVSFENLNVSIKDLFVGKDGTLWASRTGHTLVRIENPEDFEDSKANNFEEFKCEVARPDTDESGGMLTMYEDENNNLWFGLHGYGLYQYNIKTGKYIKHVHDVSKPESLSSNNIESILIDNTNVLWVGTEEGGLNKCDLKQKEIMFFNENLLSKNSLSNSSVNAISKGEGDTFWIGTQDGLNRVKFGDNFEKPFFEHFYINRDQPSFKTQEHIWSILKDKDGFYWLGTTNGVVRMSQDNNTQEVSFKSTDFDMLEVFSTLEDENGTLWFGSMINGLIKWDKTKKNHSSEYDFSTAIHYLPDSNNKYSISAKEVSCLYEDSKHNIWVGTAQGGLNLIVPGIDGAPDQFVVYKHDEKNPNSLSHNSIYSILEDKEGVFWIGTFGGGLNKMTLPATGNSDPVFKCYTEKDGLANNAVYGLLEDDNGILWVSTDNGISSFNPKTETFKNFNKEDGLQSNNFRMNAYFKSKEGYLFFGGLKGLNVFHPKKLKENSIKAIPRLTGFKIKNETIIVDRPYEGRVLFKEPVGITSKPIELRYDENTLTFEFAALHYAAPEKNKFKYKLVGFDKEWVDSKALSLAHYTNLPPGNYTFMVKASNNDGLWNDEPAILKLKIQPPFWLTWWAYIFYILCFIGVLWSIQSYFNLKSKQQASLEIQKEIEAVNKLKLQFFTNISHDFKTPITLILNPVEELLESVIDNRPVQTKLKVVQRNANSLLRLVHQLMEFRKIEVGETKLGATESNIINFIREIVFSFRASARKKEIDISFDSEVYAIDAWFDWDKLEKILNNLIHNAIKFTPSGGQITVRVSKSREKEELNIEDRGVKASFLKIEIEDTGLGIDKDELPYVFQRFYQVDQTKRMSKKGSGIGLAITKDLVDLHFGTIEVNSEKGKGSCFEIKLPLGKAHLLPEEIVETVIPAPLSEEEMDIEYMQEKANSPEEIVGGKFKNTILVVDDNADIRDLVKEGFSNKYNVLEAENGKEALNITLKELPDLIISDVLMPEMDGVEYCQTLKNNIRTSHIPVILLTALNSVEHRIEGLESGADAYIPKPFKMKLLSVRVEKLIATRDLMRKRFQTEKELTPEKVTLNSLDEEFLKRIMDFMEKNMSNESYWVDELASDMNTSRSTFFRKLKKLTGQAPNDFMRMVRLKRSVQLMEQNELTISQISYMVGFSEPNYFGKCFRKFYGDTPSNYINSHYKKKSV
ncbi:hybrid sensor histidine kinase/response regulator transcription factor [uncultured Algibacter sp.]|uniref:hybrid sensor histidine kinase/response regulator transcription factor n=1 Tax=uncultured Algibacter sp. TaxID=298659 RepID=UPI0026244467|nr:hybrid sensor histidine kinase/response regulator transcription factor [uncultured Algibacter sp.]